MLPTGERLGCAVLLIFQLYSTFSAKIKALRRCKGPIPGVCALHFRHAWLTGQSVPGSGIRGEMRFQLVGYALPRLGIGGGGFFFPCFLAGFSFFRVWVSFVSHPLPPLPPFS